MWAVNNMLSVDPNMPTARWNRWRWVGKHIPYVSWVLTFYSTYVFVSPMYPILMDNPKGNPFIAFTKDPAILLTTNVLFEPRSRLLLLTLVAILSWVVAAEVVVAIQFIWTTSVRESWPPHVELVWYQRRRFVCAMETIMELTINYCIATPLRLTVALLSRVMVMLIISKYMGLLRASITRPRDMYNRHLHAE